MKNRSTWICALLGIVALCMLVTFSCQSPGREQRQDRAYTALEKLLIYELTEVGTGNMTVAEAAADLRKALDDLKAAEMADQPAPLTIGEVGGVAGVVTAVGGLALNYLRNKSRGRELQDVPTFDDVSKKLEDRLKELESRARPA